MKFLLDTNVLSEAVKTVPDLHVMAMMEAHQDEIDGIIDERAARWHAQERARLAAQGLTAPFVDGQIAAIAKVNSLILVTRNTSDYENFSAVKVQNWHIQ